MNQDSNDHMVETTVLFVVSALKGGGLRLKVNNATSETDARVIQVPTPPKSALAETWQALGDICDFTADQGGGDFYPNTEYVVRLSSFACTEFKLRDATRSLESIATSLSTIPVSIENGGAGNRDTIEAAMKIVDDNADPLLVTAETMPKGGEVFTFRVSSIAALNRMMRQEVSVKPCRCVVRSCTQTVWMTIRHLVIPRGASQFAQLNSDEKE